MHLHLSKLSKLITFEAAAAIAANRKLDANTLPDEMAYVNAEKIVRDVYFTAAAAVTAAVSIFKLIYRRQLFHLLKLLLVIISTVARWFGSSDA